MEHGIKFILGGIELEVVSDISDSSGRNIATLSLIGDDPESMDMGKRPRRFRLSGWFTGPNALLLINKLKKKMDEGKPVNFVYTWAPLKKIKSKVLIQNVDSRPLHRRIRFDIELVEAKEKISIILYTIQLPNLSLLYAMALLVAIQALLQTMRAMSLANQLAAANGKINHSLNEALNLMGEL